jgi:hypothetical protein
MEQSYIDEKELKAQLMTKTYRSIGYIHLSQGSADGADQPAPRKRETAS